MPEVGPFTGLLFDPSVTGPLHDLTAPPYDAITPLDQDRYYGASPFNVVRLILGKDDAGDDSRENKYTRAASFLRSWQEQGILVRTPEPCIYPYEFSFHLHGSHRRVRGVIVAVTLEPPGGSIIPHERTLLGPIADRLSLLRAAEANLSPIYTLFAGPSRALGELLSGLMAVPADREAIDEQGTRHRLWVSATGADVVADAVRDERIWIADGHHRYTVALAYREEMRAAVGPGPWDFMMTLLLDASAEDPPVLPIHRLRVRGTGPPAQPAPAGYVVRDLAEILATIRDEDLTYGRIRSAKKEVVHSVERLTGSPPTVRLLHDRVLDLVPPEDLRFVPDAVLAEEAIRSGEATEAYLLPPTKVERVLAVVEGGRRLPQKSTYFWPKPRTGMVIRPLLR